MAKTGPTSAGMLMAICGRGTQPAKHHLLYGAVIPAHLWTQAWEPGGPESFEVRARTLGSPCSTCSTSKSRHSAHVVADAGRASSP